MTSVSNPRPSYCVTVSQTFLSCGILIIRLLNMLGGILRPDSFSTMFCIDLGKSNVAEILLVKLFKLFPVAILCF